MKSTHHGLDLHPDARAVNWRQAWAANRLWMETEAMKSKRYGGMSRRWWYLMQWALVGVKWGLKLTRQYARGNHNAWDIRLCETDVPLAALPEAFDGFTLLHLSDLHLDGMPGLERRILDTLGNRAVDLVAITGDFRHDLHGLPHATLEQLETLLAGISSRCGVVGVLGNHDDCHMVEPLEQLGIRMLINEQMWIDRGGQRLQIIGTDDVHYYYTDLALHALRSADDDACTVALVHSPELADAAAEAGVNLYLTGHTHGGQIALPGGRAIIRRLNHRCRHLYKGLWHRNGMTGVTSRGVGTAGIPVRFNTRGELLLLTLRRP